MVDGHAKWVKGVSAGVNDYSPKIFQRNKRFGGAQPEGFVFRTSDSVPDYS